MAETKIKYVYTDAKPTWALATWAGTDNNSGNLECRGHFLSMGLGMAICFGQSLHRQDLRNLLSLCKNLQDLRGGYNAVLAGPSSLCASITRARRLLNTACSNSSLII